MTFESFDRAYLHELQRGDRSVEDHFVQYFSTLIVLKVRSRGWDGDTANDVLQETFARALTLIRTPGGVHEPAALGALVNSICNNVLREHSRTKGKTEALDDETAALLVEPRSSALTRMIEEGAGAAVSHVLRQLNMRDRELLRAVLMEESDKDDVCKKLGVSRDHLRVLLHRAKLAFRTRYLSDSPVPASASFVDKQHSL